MTFSRFFDFSIRNSSDDICMSLAWQVSSTSPSGGNQVDGLQPASSTETIAKLARLGPAKNDELVTEFGRSNKVLSMKYMKTQRKVCQAYIEDQYRCDKI